MGAALWTFTFITLGKILGEKWHYVTFYLSHYSIYVIVLFVIILLIVYFVLKERIHQIIYRKGSGSIFIESDPFYITVILQMNGQGIQMLFQALARY